MLDNTNLWNNLGFGLYAALFACHMITTSDEQFIFIDYQTSKLQYNYQSYIQVDNIEDTQSFSSIAFIFPSEGFSDEILTGVRQEDSAIED